SSRLKVVDTTTLVPYSWLLPPPPLFRILAPFGTSSFGRYRLRGSSSIGAVAGTVVHGVSSPGRCRENVSSESPARFLAWMLSAPGSSSRHSTVVLGAEASWNPRWNGFAECGCGSCHPARFSDSTLAASAASAFCADV